MVLAKEFKDFFSDPIILLYMSTSKYRNNAPPSKVSDGATRSDSLGISSKAAATHRASAADKQRQPNDSDSADKSGRVAFDAKGNPVWEWQTSTGVFEQDVSTQRLKKLEAPELSLASTQPVPTIGNKSNIKTKSKEDTGFNPYNSDGPVKPRTDRTAAAHPALVHKKPPPKRQETPKPTGVWNKFKSKF